MVLADILEDIARIKQEVQLLITSLHWGVVFNPHPSPEAIKIAHTLIDAGVDIVVGHHPHTVQKIELYKKGIIAYSLGNFISDPKFYDRRGRPTEEMLTSILLRIDVNSNQMKHEIIPITMQPEGYLERSSPMEEKRIFAHLEYLATANSKEKFYGEALEEVFLLNFSRIWKKILQGDFQAVFSKLTTIRIKHIGYGLNILRKRFLNKYLTTVKRGS